MKQFLLQIITILILFQLDQIETTQNGIISLPLKKKHKNKLGKYQRIRKHKNSQNQINLQNDRGGNTYYVEIFVGDYPTQFQVQLDTGSSWLWVYTERCGIKTIGLETLIKSNKLKKSKHLFKRHKNSQHKIFFQEPDFSHFNQNSYSYCKGLPNKTKIQYSYGDGPINGFYTKQTVKFIEGQQIDDQDLLLVFLQGFDSLQGLLGIGLIQSLEYQTIFQTMRDKGLIQKSQFSLYLSTNYQVINEESKFIIGGYDPLYMGEKQFTYTNIISENGYLVKLQDLLIVGQSLFSESKNITALIDSGTSLITLNQDNMKKLIKILKQNYQLNCWLEPESVAILMNYIVNLQKNLKNILHYKLLLKEKYLKYQVKHGLGKIVRFKLIMNINVKPIWKNLYIIVILSQEIFFYDIIMFYLIKMIKKLGLLNLGPEIKSYNNNQELLYYQLYYMLLVLFQI